jgi:hypothetical protein
VFGTPSPGWDVDKRELTCGELALAVRTAGRDNNGLGHADGVVLGVVVCILEPRQPNAGMSEVWCNSRVHCAAQQAA